MSTLERLTPQRHLPLPGTHNVRDVGGYPAGSGTTRWGVLIRADALHRLGETGQAAVRELGIRTVLDLREPAERDIAPDPFPGPVPEPRRLPIFNERIPINGEVSLEIIYRRMVDDFGDRLTAAVRELCRPGALPAIVHCSAGKDRTGVVVALALLVAGVAPEIIAADYALTGTFLGAEYLADAERSIAEYGLPQQLRDHAVACPPELILSTLERVTARHGSVTGFLLAHGATPEELATLRTALIETPEETMNRPTHTIVQISDTHTVPEGTLLHDKVDTTANLNAALAAVEALGDEARAVVLTGDLEADIESYRRLRGIVDALHRARGHSDAVHDGQP